MFNDIYTGRTRMGALTLGAFTLIAALLLAAPAARADIDRDEAIAIMNKVLSPVSFSHEAAYYLTLAPLGAGAVIGPWGDEGRDVTLAAQTWFGYIDDEPAALFSHRVRYVFIDATTGATRVVQQRWFPIVDGVAIFSEAAVTAEPDLEVFNLRKVIADTEDE